MHILFQTIPWLAKELSDGSFLSATRICLLLWYFAITRKFFGSNKDFPFRASYNSQPITFYMRHVMDLAVLREIFIEKEYEWFPVVDPKVIIDLGAHFGDTSLYYHARFPNARIIAVEPSPENYERLVKHTENIPNIIPIQAAAGARDGEITLNLLPSTLGHSVMERKESENSVTVPQLSLATLFKQQGIEKADLIKFDIEGAEFSLFRNTKPGELAHAFVGELHFDLVEAEMKDFANAFSDYVVKLQEIKSKRFLFFAKKQ